MSPPVGAAGIGGGAVGTQGSMPWLDDPHEGIFYTSSARIFDGGMVVHIQEELTSPKKPFANYTNSCLGFGSRLTAYHVPSFKTSLTSRGAIHLGHDGVHHHYNPHDLSKSADHFVANFRR